MEPSELKQIAGKINLVFDNPESVTKQVKQINFAQKQLRQFKKELSASIRNINESATQASADSMLSALSDLMGSRKLAGSFRASNRKKIQKAKKEARDPFYAIKSEIDQLLLEGDRLKLLAEEYLEDPKAFQARIIQKEQQKLREKEVIAEQARIKQNENLEKAAIRQENYSILYKKKWFKQYLIIGLSICFFIFFIQGAFVGFLAIFALVISVGILAEQISK